MQHNRKQYGNRRYGGQKTALDRWNFIDVAEKKKEKRIRHRCFKITISAITPGK